MKKTILSFYFLLTFIGLYAQSKKVATPIPSSPASINTPADLPPYWSTSGNTVQEQLNTDGDILGSVSGSASRPIFFKSQGVTKMTLSNTGIHIPTLRSDLSTITTLNLSTLQGNLSFKNGFIYGNTSTSSSLLFSILGNTTSLNGPFIEMYDKSYTTFPDRAGNLVLGAYKQGTTAKGKIVFAYRDQDNNNWVTTAQINPDGYFYCRGIRVLPVGTAYPDYVFAKDYKLMSLKDLEKYINDNHHLPNIPSATELEHSNSIDLAEMNRLLLEKVEEQTLYILQLEKRMQKIEHLNKNQ